MFTASHWNVFHKLMTALCILLVFGCDSAITNWVGDSRSRPGKVAELSLSPATATLAIGNTKTFSALGGASPYSFTLLSGPGSVDSVTGVFSATGSTGSSVIQVKDAKGLTATAAITTNAALTSTSTSITQRAAPGSASYLDGAEISGGVPPYSYSIVSGDGLVQSATGLYTTPNSQSITRVKVTDAIANTIEVQVQDYPLYVNGTIYSSVVTSSTAFMGGMFTRSKPSYTPGVVLINESNGAIANSDCNYKRKLNFGASVFAVAYDGSNLYIGGSSMTAYSGTSIGNLIKIKLSDCSLDTSFTQATTVNGMVTSLLLVSSSLYAVGSFTTYRGAAQPYLLKLSTTTGVADATFNTGTTFDNSVTSIVHSAGSLFIGGYFTTYRGSPGQGIVKISATTGALDTTFTQATGFSGSLRELLIEGSSIYVCGNPSTYRGASVMDQILKLDTTNGNLDTGFNLSLDFPGKCYSLASDGTSLYVAGEYWSVWNVATPFSSQNLTKVSLATGAVDTTFSQLTGLVASGVGAASVAYFNNYVYVSSYDPFDTFRGAPVASFFRVSPVNGNLDSIFSKNVGLNSRASRIVNLGGGTIALAGNFSNYAGNLAEGLVKMDVDTKVIDTAYSSGGGFNGYVQALTLLGSSVYVGGNFTRYQGATANYLSKIDQTTGALDTTFTQATGASGLVRSILSANSSLYIAGGFITYRGSPANNIAKINPTSGNLDTTFTQATGIARTSSTSYAAGLATDGVSSIYVGGYFNLYRGTAMQNLAKLDWNSGNLDTTFTQATGINGAGNFGPAFDLIYTAGSIYVGGYFTTYRGVAAQRLAKLDATSGMMDTTFTQATGFAGSVAKLLLNGTSLYVLGGGATYRGTNVFGISKIDLSSGNLDLSFQSTSGFTVVPSALLSYGSNSILTFGGCTYRGVNICGVIKIDKGTGALQ